MTKSKKLPYLPFYVGDLKKEAHYKVLPPLAKLLWLEILFVMWDSELRGMLMLNGKPMTEKQIASVTELDIRLVKQNLPIIKQSQICSVTDDGIIYCRSMTRRCELSVKRSEAGKSGGNPILLIQNENKLDKQTLDIDIDNEIDINNKKNSPPKPPPLEIQTSKYFEVAKAALVPDNDPSIQSDNRYTNAGRKPLVKYPKIWLSIFVLADTLEQYEISGIPIDERNYHHKAFKTVQSKLETYEQEGKPTKSVSCYSWLTNWAMHEVLESIIKTNRLKKSEAA